MNDTTDIEKGVLPIQKLEELLKNKSIVGIDRSYLNPASIDLPLSKEAYRLEGTFLPKRGEKIRKILSYPSVSAKPHDLKNPLEVGVSYIVRLEGKVSLPKNIYGYINPKSSTGRINLFCRVVADGVPFYDTVAPAGWSGEMWLLIRADSFAVLVSPNQALSQLRLFNHYTVLNQDEMKTVLKVSPLLWKSTGTPYKQSEVQVDNDGSLLLTLDLSSKLAGYECKNPSKILDIENKHFYKPEDFFTPAYVEQGSVTLRKGRFYILSTREAVMVPPHLSAEVRPIDVRFGEFRTHAAGYVDPGWGWNQKGTVKGQPITLEVIPYEDVVIREGQIVGRIRFERMGSVPSVVYGASGKSHYTKQKAAKLSKHFKI
jgi:dCTP deaminase